MYVYHLKYFISDVVDLQDWWGALAELRVQHGPAVLCINFFVYFLISKFGTIT